MDSDPYKKRGVDLEKAGQILSDFGQYLKHRPQDSNLLEGIGPFASAYCLKTVLEEIKNPVLVTCCDGVGTKSLLALQWHRLEGIGVDLVAMNVNDLLCLGARPLLFLDYYATASLDASQMVTILKSIQLGCEQSSCSLVGGETAQMPDLYSGSDFDLAGFAVGIASRDILLGPNRVKEGDRVLGIESSGFHSNGYSLIRKIIQKENIQPDEKSPFEDCSWSQILLRPTHLYVSALLPLRPKIHALAHNTGGGLYENLPRAIPPKLCAVIESSRWHVPHLFAWMGEKAGMDLDEMLSTFNCGIGMFLVVAKDQCNYLIEKIRQSGLNCMELGWIESRSGHAKGVLWK